MHKKSLWVVKIGSNMVIDGGALLIRELVKQIKILKENYKISVIWVTSGAIATAKLSQNFKKSKNKILLSEKQALSAIGQPLLMNLYKLAFDHYGLKNAQILLTKDDLKIKKRHQNIKNTILTLLKWNVVPIINENDTVATDEIKFGDNDNLAALIAKSLDAKNLILLTNVDGFYKINPKSIKNNENLAKYKITYLNKITNYHLNLCQNESKFGTGGMKSKLLAAKKVLPQNIKTFLVKGDEKDVLIKIANNENPGTLIARSKL